MIAIWATLKMQMKALLQYRAAAFAGICTQLFWGIVVMMILKAFYTGEPLEPLSLSNAISFIWIAQALVQLLPWALDRQIEEQIRNGSVAYELVRPLDLYAYWFTRAFSLRLAPTLLRCGPIFLLSALFFDLPFPHAPLSFLASVFFAFLLSASLSTLILLTLFWTLAGEGIQRLMLPTSLLLSGMVIPLPLYPDSIKPFLSIQPLRGLMDIPCRLYTGLIPSSDAPFYLAFQLAWICFFVLLGRLLMARATRRFVIQGG